MSTLKKQKTNMNAMAAASEAAKNAITARGSELTSQDLTANMVSLESMSQEVQTEAMDSFERVENELKATLGEALGAEVGLESAEINAAGLEAATITAMAAGNPAQYHEAAMDVTNVSTESHVAVTPLTTGVAGSVVQRSEVSLEAFDEQSLRGKIGHSIMFNAMAATQDRFGEAFYPTVVLTPDQPGLKITISRAMVMNEYKRSQSGAPADFNKVSLIDAMVNHKILENNANEVVPHLLADDSNKANFVDITEVAPYERDVNGTAVRTSALAIGRQMDLLGLSMNAGAVVGQMGDHLDSLDQAITLSSVVLKIVNKDATTTEYVTVSLDRMPKTAFTQNAENDHDSREMTLAFDNAAVSIVKGMTMRDGAAAGLLDALDGKTLRIGLRLHGTVNTETGNIIVDASAVTHNALVDNTTGEALALGGADAVAILEQLNMTVVGFNVKATRSNATLRTAGIFVESSTRTECYTVGLGAPISVNAPVAQDTTASDLKSLIAAARTQNCNNAVTALLNRNDELARALSAPLADGEVANVQGIGRFLVRGFYEHKELDVKALVDTEKSHEKRQDLMALLNDTIRDLAYRMREDSNYNAALDFQAMGTNEKPKLIIGTDPVLAQYLMTPGEDRTYGPDIDFEIVTSVDERMKDRILITFSRGKTGQIDPLTFGVHAYMPELTTTAQVTVGSGQVKRAQVQPRNGHINNLPILASLVVKNVTELLTSKAN